MRDVLADAIRLVIYRQGKCPPNYPVPARLDTMLYPEWIADCIDYGMDELGIPDVDMLGMDWNEPLPDWLLD